MWLLWIPRILAILLILFMSLFSFDVFFEQAPLWEKIAGLFIHNIPSILILLALIFTWKHPLWGGLAFLLIALGVTFSFKTYEMLLHFAVFSVPLLAISFFMLLVYLLRRKKALIS
jgi:uncharacterized membrane protein (DUF2068 family)